MANDYYNGGSYPATGASGASAPARSEFTDIVAGFDKLPTLTANANKAVIVNSGATGMTVTTGTLALAGNFSTTGAFNTVFAQVASITLTLPAATDTLVGRASTDTLTNKTLTAPVLSGTITGTYTLAGTPTITSPTINTPTIPATEWTNATHTHAGASTGGQIAISDSTGTLAVARGGTGATTLTDGGIVLGSGTGAVTVLARGTNGQVLIGSTGVDPVMATITGGTNIGVSNGAGTITVNLDSTLTGITLTTPTISSTGFTNAQHAHAAANSGGQIATSNLTGHDRTAHDALGTGAIVFEDETQTLTAKTLTTPTISSTGFTNAQHAHAAANSGGQIPIANTTGTLTVARGGTGATTLASNSVLTGNGTSAITAEANLTFDGTTLDLIGGQLKFPATAVPSADANTLDDYEEGTFTPTADFSGGSGTVLYGTQNGSYTKIGNTVFIRIELVTTSIASRTGNLRIGGLPFTSHATTIGTFHVGAASGLAITAGYSLTGETIVSSTQLAVRLWDSILGASNLQDTEWTDDGSLALTGQYII